MVGRTETLLGKASACLSAGQIADAEGAYNTLLDEDPGEYRAHLGLADCVAARGLSDWAVDHLVENARAYAEQELMRGAFALMTKALAIAPGRLDLHIDVAEFEATDGRPEMAALRLENLARTYIATGQEEEAELVLEAAAAFRAEPEPPMFEPDEVGSAPFVNPITGQTTPAPRLVITPNVPNLRAAASPPPPPPATRAAAAPSPIDPAPTPVAAMVRPTPLKPQAVPPPPPKPEARATKVLSKPRVDSKPPAPPKVAAAPKPKRSSRGRASVSAPKWRPSTVTQDPPPRPKKPASKPGKAIAAKAAPNVEKRVSIAKSPRPRKAAAPIASYPKQRPSLAAAPSPKRGGKKLEKLPPLRPAGSLAMRLRASSTSPRGTSVGDEDRTTLWRRAT